MDKGLIHIYTGNGKGKTTAATGLALRAYQSGKRVCIVQFLKTAESGEIEYIKSLNSDKFQVFRFESEHGFVDCADKSYNDNLQEDINTALSFVKSDVLSGKYDVIVLDEIICANSLGYIKDTQMCEIIDTKPFECEIVMTGRGAGKYLIEKADYVTEMKLIKHPYNEGIMARRGIEF